MEPRLWRKEEQLARRELTACAVWRAKGMLLAHFASIPNLVYAALWGTPLSQAALRRTWLWSKGN